MSISATRECTNVLTIGTPCCCAHASKGLELPEWFRGPSFVAGPGSGPATPRSKVETPPLTPRTAGALSMSAAAALAARPEVQQAGAEAILRVRNAANWQCRPELDEASAAGCCWHAAPQSVTAPHIAGRTN
jgi:hypothetical protein